MSEEKDPVQEEELTSSPEEAAAQADGGEAAGACGGGKCGQHEGHGACGQHEGHGACGQHEGHGKCEKREKREKELEAARAEAADYKDKWMRTAAEFDNFRKRNEQTRRNAYLDGKADVLLKILPVGDNLERALASCADENTKKGIEMVLRSFKKLLEDEGIEAIDPKDEEFDPAFCEAILSEPAAEGVEPGYVKEVFVKGYRRGDKVLRYAQVKVTT